MPPHSPSSTTTNSFSQILATAKLAGLALTIPSGFEMGRTNKTPEFLSKFPLGKIPAFEGFTSFSADQVFALSESSAIAYYLAESTPDPKVRDQLLGGTTPQQRALVRQWTDFDAVHVTPAIEDLLGWRLGSAQYDAAREEAAAADLKRWLDYTEAHLEGRTWLAGDANVGGPSLADIHLGGTMFLGLRVYIDEEMREEYPKLVRWYLNLRAVPGFSEFYPDRMADKRKKQE